MKQRFKFLTLALGLLMGMTMTSCLGDEGEPMDGRFGVVAKVYSSYFTSFRTPGETPILITPTESSINAIENNNAGFSMSHLNGQVVAIDYTWNPVVNGGAVGSANDSVATHPIISINPQINGYTYKPYFFDNNHTEIIVPVQYYCPLNSQATSFSVSLVYYPDDVATQADKANGILRLHVNYRVLGVEEFSAQYKSSDITYYYGLGVFFHSYRLNGNILSAWGGMQPSAVNLVVDENSYNTKLDDQQTKHDQVYPVLSYEEYAADYSN